MAEPERAHRPPLWPAVLVVAAVALVVFGVVLLVAARNDMPLISLTQDPAGTTGLRWQAGLLYKVGLLVWGAITASLPGRRGGLEAPRRRGRPQRLSARLGGPDARLRGRRHLPAAGGDRRPRPLARARGVRDLRAGAVRHRRGIQADGAAYRVRCARGGAGSPRQTAGTRRRDSQDDTQDLGRGGPHLPRSRPVLAVAAAPGDCEAQTRQGHLALARDREGRSAADDPGQLLRLTAGPLGGHLRRATQSPRRARPATSAGRPAPRRRGWSPGVARSITVRVPSMAPGSHKVYVTVGGRSSNSYRFSISAATIVTGSDVQHGVPLRQRDRGR